MSNQWLAQSTGEAGIDLGDSYTLADGRRVKEVFDQPSDLVNLIVPNLFVLAGIALMIFTIIAGYKYIAQGKKGAQEAAKIAGGVVAGFLVMFAAYWIVQIIKLVTGADIPI